MLKKSILPNGINLATYDMPSIKSLHVGITVKGGSLVDKPEKNGLAHYMEHMLVQGIPSLPTAQSMSNFIESVSGTYNAYTSASTVHFMIHVPFLYAEDALRIASEVFFQPLFPEGAMEKERHAVINEITQEMDSRWFKFNEFFRAIRYTKTSPLQQPTVGSIATIQKVTREDVQTYWEEYFSTQNTYLFIGGNFKQKQLDMLVEKYFGNIKKGKNFTGFPHLSANNDFTKRQVAIRHDDKLQANYIDLVYPALATDDTPEEHLKQFLALTILGRLRSSRLFRILRYEKGYVYGVSISNAEWPGVGYASAYSEVQPEYLDEVVKILIDELYKFIQEGPTQEELVLAKNFLTNQWLMIFDNPSSIAGWIEGQLLWRDKILLPEDDIAMLKNITSQEIISFMQKKWNMKKIQLIIQGPLEASKENLEKFQKILAELDK